MFRKPKRCSEHCNQAGSDLLSGTNPPLRDAMPFDIDKAVKWIDDNALPPFGSGHCATWVRKALEAGGLDTTGHPEYAKDWGPTLTRLGFGVVDAKSYIPRKGDIIVIQGTSTSKPGHIELYDGTHWVSDFIQPHPKDIYPGPSYRKEKPAYKIYRPS